jgi:hypothetical protein
MDIVISTEHAGAKIFQESKTMIQDVTKDIDPIKTLQSSFDASTKALKKGEVIIKDKTMGGHPIKALTHVLKK